MERTVHSASNSFILHFKTHAIASGQANEVLVSFIFRILDSFKSAFQIKIFKFALE
jgi:hypothetical protein